MSNNNNNNKTVVPQAKQALNQMKLEIAGELGMSNYENIDKGNLTARQNGYVGGYMTKKLVEMAEKQKAGKLLQEICSSIVTIHVFQIAILMGTFLKIYANLF